MKVMVVEDNNVLADALMIVLKDKGYELSLATDGEEAEKRFYRSCRIWFFLIFCFPRRAALKF